MHYPHHTLRQTACLDGSWDFAFLGPCNPAAIDLKTIVFDDRITVPGAFDAMPAWTARRGVAVYRTQLCVPTGRRGRLQFDGVSMWCEVHIDGQKLAEHSGGYSRFWVDVPPATVAERELLVIVDNQFDYTRSPIQREYFDWYQYGGIIRPVTLHVLPKEFLTSVQVETRDWKTGAIRVRTRFGGPAPTPDTVTLSIDNAPVKSSAATSSGDTITWDLRAPNPAPWTPEKPHLHTLAVTTGQDDMIVRFGLRQVSIGEKSIFINGSPIKLVGFNRHENHPEFGPALPENLMLTDLQILRDMGCNFIRGSHYPQDQRFLDLCDELGFMVWEEGCAWQPHTDDFQNARFMAVQMQGVDEMIAASFNHPCVIMWGFFNEGETRSECAREAYCAMRDAIRKHDATRIVSFADNHPLDSMVLDLADVLCANIYPGWYWGTLSDVVPYIRRVVDVMRGKGGDGKPCIISEIGAAALYGCRDGHEVRWTESYQSRLLNLAARECVSNPEINGLAIWQFCDGRTSDVDPQKALGRPRGFNNKGVVDEYRRPKQAVETVRSVFKGA